MSIIGPPRPVQVVEADSSSTDPTTPGYYSGSVLAYNTQTGLPTEREKCWILPVESLSGAASSLEVTGASQDSNDLTDVKYLRFNGGTVYPISGLYAGFAAYGFKGGVFQGAVTVPPGLNSGAIVPISGQLFQFVNPGGNLFWDNVSPQNGLNIPDEGGVYFVSIFAQWASAGTISQLGTVRIITVTQGGTTVIDDTCPAGTVALGSDIGGPTQTCAAIANLSGPYPLSLIVGASTDATVSQDVAITLGIQYLGFGPAAVFPTTTTTTTSTTSTTTTTTSTSTTTT